MAYQLEMYNHAEGNSAIVYVPTLEQRVQDLERRLSVLEQTHAHTQANNQDEVDDSNWATAEPNLKIQALIAAKEELSPISIYEWIDNQFWRHRMHCGWPACTKWFISSISIGSEPTEEAKRAGWRPSKNWKKPMCPEHARHFKG